MRAPPVVFELLRKSFWCRARFKPTKREFCYQSTALPPSHLFLFLQCCEKNSLFFSRKISITFTIFFQINRPPRPSTASLAPCHVKCTASKAPYHIIDQKIKLFILMHVICIWIVNDKNLPLWPISHKCNNLLAVPCMRNSKSGNIWVKVSKCVITVWPKRPFKKLNEGCL